MISPFDTASNKLSSSSQLVSMYEKMIEKSFLSFIKMIHLLSNFCVKLNNSLGPKKEKQQNCGLITEFSI